MESLTGRLLVATPALKDPNFERTVVLLVAHEPGGSLGVVLNRATEVAVADVLDGWGALAGDPGGGLRGRPGAARGGDLPGPDQEPTLGRVAGFNRVSGAVGTLDLSQDPGHRSTTRSSAYASSPATPAGTRASSKPRSRPARGSSSTRCRATPS